MKKVLLLPMMLMGVALSFTSCGDDDDPGKDPDVVTYDFKNLPADSGTKPTEDQMSAVVATFVDEVALPTYKDMLTKMTAYKNAVDKFIASGSKNDLAYPSRAPSSAPFRHAVRVDVRKSVNPTSGYYRHTILLSHNEE